MHVDLSGLLNPNSNSPTCRWWGRMMDSLAIQPEKKREKCELLLAAAKIFLLPINRPY